MYFSFCLLRDKCSLYKNYFYRCILPVAVESTDALIKVYINEHEGKKSGLNMEDSIRNAYSLAIIR